MKKLLLLVAAATLTLGATAATPKIATPAIKSHQTVRELKSSNVLGAQMMSFDKVATSGARRAKTAVTPEGTPQIYIFSAYYDSGAAVSVSFSEDGSSVYFSNMFPYIFDDEQAWVKGIISTDGTSVTIPIEPIAEIETTTDGVLSAYPVELLVDEEGYYAGYKELVFAKTEEGRIYIEDDYTDPQRLIYLVALDENGEFLGWFDYNMIISYDPYTGPTEVVELPEGAQPEDYVYIYYAASLFGAYQVIEGGQVYVDGNDVYMNLLTCGMEAWVKGTKDGNTVTFPGGQFVNLGAFLSFQPFYTDGTADEEGNLYIYPCDYVMTFDPESNTYVPAEVEGKDFYTGLFLPDESLYTYAFDYTVGKPFEGAAVPADPYDPYLALTDYKGANGQYQYYFDYYLDPFDVDGRILNTNNLAYYIYMDDEPYTLTPDVFENLTEDMTLIPYDFSDGWDIGAGYLYIAEPLLTSLGVQAVYTVGEEVNYSNVVSIDLEGNVYTVPAPQLNPDGLNNVNAKQITSIAIYDAEGRKLEAAQKGVNVVKMVASDGTVKAVKMYKK
ncbi:MAG: hypothetical protein IKX25_06835 [Bacteroidales bacterium]|nr:hypothetical protein [Bacteroidales bacterium]